MRKGQCLGVVLYGIRTPETQNESVPSGTAPPAIFQWDETGWPDEFCFFLPFQVKSVGRMKRRT